MDGGFKACGGTGASGRVRRLVGLQGEDGRLTGFSVNGTKIGDSLVDLTGQAPISSPGLYEVQPEHAYRSPQSGTLFVLVTITAEDAALAPRPGIYIEQDQILNGIETRAPATHRRRLELAGAAGLPGRAGHGAGRPGHLRPRHLRARARSPSGSG